MTMMTTFPDPTDLVLHGESVLDSRVNLNTTVSVNVVGVDIVGDTTAGGGTGGWGSHATERGALEDFFNLTNGNTGAGRDEESSSTSNVGSSHGGT